MAAEVQNLPDCRNAPKLVHIRRFLPLESCVLSLVSCFLYIGRGSITFVVRALQISSFMQNKANFPESQMNVNKVLTEDYENETLGGCGKNKANSKPNKANLLNAQMNVTTFLTKDYENMSNWAIYENKPNTKPIKANFQKAGMNITTFLTKDYENIPNLTLFENKPNPKPIQTQTKPKQTQFQTRFYHKSMNIEVEDPAFRGRNQSSTGPFVVSLCPVSRESISIRNSFAAKKYTAADMIFIIFVFIISPFFPIRSRFLNHFLLYHQADQNANSYVNFSIQLLYYLIDNHDTKNGKSFDQKELICDYILQFDFILLSEPFGAVLV